jgi:predicted nucleotide-binding protein (sugar kinase/HSP70/actin superfamily)
MSIASRSHADAEPARAGARLRTDVDCQVAWRVDAERLRLLQEAGLDDTPVDHFRRPEERPFTAAERGRVTILFGGLTWKHERLIVAAFAQAGYRAESLPVPDVAAYQIGREFGNNGQCNPTYFTVGHLIAYLRQLESRGLSRQAIVDGYVFFTAGSCGPCRFGMYEAEYRLALQNAGYDGFRVLLFQQADGLKAASGHGGLRLTPDFGFGALNALNLGDIVHDLSYQLRPYEVVPGATDAAVAEAADALAAALHGCPAFDVDAGVSRWLRPVLARSRWMRYAAIGAGKVRAHFYRPAMRDALACARERLASVTVDRLRVKPVVKVTGEFWAQTTEGDGNFRMFAFLEREGAEVTVDQVGNWVMYLAANAREHALVQRRLDLPRSPWAIRARIRAELKARRRLALLSLGRGFYRRQHARASRALGGLAHDLADADMLINLATPYYHKHARGGEGNLEVAKSIYYTTTRRAHMVLSLKPFGCMPSSQSDGVQSAVMNRIPGMIFLPIETSGEGEVNAHSRVQMALGEARAKARAEFEQALGSTGVGLDDIRSFVADHPDLQRPFYRVPHVPGVTGTAARFVLHVAGLMRGRGRVRMPDGGPS